MTFQGALAHAEAAAPPAEEPDAALAEFLRGGLGAKLGLSRKQLNVGLTLARNHLARGAADEAMKIYVGLVLCEPMNVDFQLGLANCAGLFGEHHLAIQSAAAVIALAPSDPRGYLISGRSCLAIRAFDEAREDLTEAARFAEQSGDALVAAEARKLLGAVPA